MKIVLPLLTLALSACATPEQHATDMANYISANYGQTCLKLGYAAGSDSHRDCMLSMYNADQVRYASPWYRPRRF